MIGYIDQGGKGIIQASLDSGAFDVFILSDGMIGDSLTDNFGKALNKSFGSLPGSTGKGAGVFADVAKANGTGEDFALFNEARNYGWTEHCPSHTESDFGKFRKVVVAGSCHSRCMMMTNEAD